MQADVFREDTSRVCVTLAFRWVSKKIKRCVCAYVYVCLERESEGKPVRQAHLSLRVKGTPAFIGSLFVSCRCNVFQNKKRENIKTWNKWGK